MTFLILRYLLAAPFAILWAVCLTGNLWLLITTIAHRPRHTPSPLGVVGFVSGLIVMLVSPLIAYVDWYVLLACAALPEVPAVLLALIGLIRSEPPQTSDGLR
ncbi:MAG: hypothetical protein ACAI43_02970 [Phycisphaerae bacterium]|nr:hypothetical protein [Tepidisphaeraceae bacterium]